MNKPVAITLICALAMETFLPSLAWATPSSLPQTPHTTSARARQAAPSSAPAPSPSPNLSPQDIAALVDLLKACDKAEQSCAQSNKDKDAVIKGQQDALEASQRALAAEEASHTGIMESKTTWFVLGMLVTGFTVYLTQPRH